MQAAFSKLESIPQAMDEIIHQLRPNNGKSVIDALTRVENGLHEMRAIRWAYEDVAGSRFFQADAKGEIIEASSGLCDLLGLDAKDVLGNGWIAAIRSDDRNRVWQEWQNAIQQRRRFDETFHIVCPDGSYPARIIKVNAKALPVRDADSRLTGFVGAVKDVIERQD